MLELQRESLLSQPLQVLRDLYFATHPLCCICGIPAVWQSGQLYCDAHAPDSNENSLYKLKLSPAQEAACTLLKAEGLLT